MNRWMMACFAVVGLGASLAVAPVGAEDRRSFPVPAWSEFDGKQWGDLIVGETTRAAFDAHYASSRTNRGEVLQAATPKRARTQMFLIFNGPGQEARLAWLVCFYEEARSAPQTAELLGRAEWGETKGIPSPGGRAGESSPRPRKGSPSWPSSKSTRIVRPPSS